MKAYYISYNLKEDWAKTTFGLGSSQLKQHGAWRSMRNKQHKDHFEWLLSTHKWKDPKHAKPAQDFYLHFFLRVAFPRATAKNQVFPFPLTDEQKDKTKRGEHASRK